MVRRIAIALFCSLLLAPPLPAQETAFSNFDNLELGADWPWWRGPQRNGLAKSQLPTKFGESENVIWKSPVPGRGHSSPIVVGGRIFLTTADETKQVQSVLAYDLATGKGLWRKVINQGGFPENNHRNNTEASPTIASDGERLFITFFHHKQVQLTALDLDGQQQWQETVGTFNPKRYEYGYGASPLLHKNSVIVAAEHDGTSYIAAFDRRTGRELWRTPRRSNITFSSPVIANVAGRDQLLLSGTGQVSSYDPNNGKLMWSVAGTATATCGTVVWTDDMVIASGGYPESETIAIAADGSRRVAWKNRHKCYEQSMIVVDGFVYALTESAGVMYCWRASDGQEMWRERVSAKVSASPIYSGEYIYWANEAGTMFVFRPDPTKFDLVSKNRLGDESFASPAIVGNRMLLRVAHGRKPNRQEYLYCIGEG